MTDDLFTPPSGHRFTEPWHVQTLAMAHALVEEGHVTAEAWAEALGEAIEEARLSGAPDTEDTYFTAALTAVERLAPITPEELSERKAAWEAAHHGTPHGQPVTLPAPAPRGT